MKDGADILFDIRGMPFFDHEDAVFALGKRQEVIIDQWVGDVENMQWHIAITVHVGEAEALQRSYHAIIKATLTDDTDLALLGAKVFVEILVADILDRSREAFGYLFLFVQKRSGGQNDARQVAFGVFQRIFNSHRRRDVFFGFKFTKQMARLDPQLQHDGAV